MLDERMPTTTTALNTTWEAKDFSLPRLLRQHLLQQQALI